ncbi:MAG: zinc ribbon domain-containing protein [Anaerolineales bacterium]|jgi:putative FmdB family regulatory protein
MPTYEYRCCDCHRPVSIFMTFAEYETGAPRCPYCNGQNLARRIRGVRFSRSEDARLEAMADPSSWGDVDEKDPRSVARMMKRMGSEMGEELGPEFHEAVDRLEAGESPEEVEKSVPGLGPEDDSSLDDY